MSVNDNDTLKDFLETFLSMHFSVSGNPANETRYKTDVLERKQVKPGIYKLPAAAKVFLGLQQNRSIDAFIVTWTEMSIFEIIT